MKLLTAILILASGFAFAAEAPPPRLAKAKVVWLLSDVESGTTLENKAYDGYVRQLLMRAGYQLAERESEADAELFVRISRYDTRETVTHLGKPIKNITSFVVMQAYEPGHDPKAKPYWQIGFQSDYFWVDATAAIVQDLVNDIKAASVVER